MGSLCLPIQYGWTSSASEKGSIRLLRISDIQRGDVNWATVPFCMTDPGNFDDFSIQKDDFLIARTGGTIGKSFLVQDVPSLAVFASYLLRVRPISSSLIPLFFLFIGCPYYWEQLIDKTNGTGQPNVNSVSLSRLKVCVPTKKYQNAVFHRYSELLPLLSKLSDFVRKSEEPVDKNL